MPTVLFMLVAGLAFVSVAVVASVNAQHGTVRDERAKSALTAAETGISQALLHYNAISPPTASPCLVQSGNTGPVGTAGVQTTGGEAGWCRAVAPQGSNFSYSVKPTSGAIEIVSRGTVDGVTRRVDVTARSASGQQIFASASVLAQSALTLDANAIVQAGSQSGGDIALSSQAKQCGVATVGIGRQLTVAGSAGYFSDSTCTTAATPSTVAQQGLILPPVNQGDVATSNDNGRITAAVLQSGSPRDLISGNRSDVSWNASARTLTVNNNTALTLTGAKYSFCNVTLNSNSALYVASGLSVNIYFDSPEACNLGSGATQLQLSSQSRITSASGAPSSIAMLFVGSPNIATNLLLSSNTQVSGACVDNFVVYAPLTNVTLNSNSQYCGAIAGKTVLISSNSLVKATTDSSSFILPNTAPHYAVSRFVECNTDAASPPNAGC